MAVQHPDARVVCNESDVNSLIWTDSTESSRIGLPDRVQAVVLAYESGLVSPGGAQA